MNRISVIEAFSHDRYNWFVRIEGLETKDIKCRSEKEAFSLKSFLEKMLANKSIKWKNRI